MSKIAVIGDKSSVLAFKALGVDVFSPQGKNDTKKTITQLAEDNYGVIFITEDMALPVKETIATYDEQFTPAIIPIPSNKGTKQLGLERIDENVEKAVGINLF